MNGYATNIITLNQLTLLCLPFTSVQKKSSLTKIELSLSFQFLNYQFFFLLIQFILLFSSWSGHYIKSCDHHLYLIIVSSCCSCGKTVDLVMAMMMAGGHGHENPNANYMNGRGFWLFYVLVLMGAHLILLSVPIDLFTVPWVWTFTNVGHNAVSFWVFHWIKSTPWLTFDQGKTDCLF